MKTLSTDANRMETTPFFYRLKNLWRSFRIAAWLGWQIESNWTDPFLFSIYAIARPLASASILVVMYSIITKGDFGSPIFAYIYLGNAFYMYVGQIMTGMAWAIIDDREHYKTLKYVYIAPVNFPTYLLGRAVARFLIASISVFLTILFGMLFLQVHIDLAAVDWPLFLLALFIGVLMLAMMGLVLSGVMLFMAHHSWGVGDALASALYLFSGAIFPLEVLPRFLRPIGLVIPITYWLELLRRTLVGSVAEAFPTLSALTNMQLLEILLGLTLVFAVSSVFVFRWCEHQASELGLIDVVTNY
jgi:ABC-2 type transport system permease protein